jgi:regulator of sirC expression with transglutaminase-like and TPR domain
MERARESELRARVREFGGAIEHGAAIDEMALALSKAMQPDLDVVGCLADLDELAATIRTPTRDGVVTELFGSGLFVGDRRDYHAWRNSCLDQVLARHRGMPITLSVLAIAVGRRLGVRLVGVGMPGHFLIGDAEAPGWFADPFHARTGLTADDGRMLYEAMGGGRWRDDMLAHTPDRLVMARILNNLLAACRRDADQVRLAVVLQLRQQLPEFAAEAPAANHAAAVLN